MKKILLGTLINLFAMSIFACPLMQFGEGTTDFWTGSTMVALLCPMPDVNYTIFVSVNSMFPGAFMYSGKSVDGFKVSGGTGANSPHQFSWLALHN